MLELRRNPLTLIVALSALLAVTCGKKEKEPVKKKTGPAAGRTTGETEAPPVKKPALPRDPLVRVRVTGGGTSVGAQWIRKGGLVRLQMLNTNPKALMP